MGLGDVGLGDGEVDFYHFEGGVAEDFPQGVDVAAVAEKHHGEAVAEAMGMCVGNTGKVS